MLVTHTLLFDIQLFLAIMINFIQFRYIFLLFLYRFRISFLFSSFPVSRLFVCILILLFYVSMYFYVYFSYLACFFSLFLCLLFMLFIFGFYFVSSNADKHIKHNVKERKNNKSWLAEMNDKFCVWIWPYSLQFFFLLFLAFHLFYQSFAYTYDFVFFRLIHILKSLIV